MWLRPSMLWRLSVKFKCNHQGLWGDLIQVATGVYVQLDGQGEGETEDPTALATIPQLEGWSLMGPRQARTPARGVGKLVALPQAPPAPKPPKAPSSRPLAPPEPPDPDFTEPPDTLPPSTP